MNERERGTDNFIRERDDFRRGKADLFKERDELTKKKDDLIRGKGVFIGGSAELESVIQKLKGNGQGMPSVSHGGSRCWRSCIRRWASSGKSHSKAQATRPVTVAAPVGREGEIPVDASGRSTKPGHSDHEIVCSKKMKCR
jgi:hypothetical protein